MEHWQKVVLVYGSLEIILSLYALWKISKYQQQENYSVIKNFFFRYLLFFLLIMAIFVAHLEYLAGAISSAWSVLVVITLMIVAIVSFLRKWVEKKQRSAKSAVFFAVVMIGVKTIIRKSYQKRNRDRNFGAGNFPM